jgi:hypothetical protein
LVAVFTVFVANLARAAAVEADVLASTLGMTPYDARLALAAGPPSVLLRTSDRNRAADVLAALRARGHGAHVFDDENFVPSEGMTKADDFQLDVEGMRRTSTGDLLPYGDVYAILRAVHDTVEATERQAQSTFGEGLIIGGERMRVVSKTTDREHIAYFFRRSGEKPWLLREHHASYVGLGDDRTPIAFTNFTRVLTRLREASPMAVYDDRLARRRVAERKGTEGERSTRQGMDLLAHLLAMTIASQGGSPYR